MRKASGSTVPESRGAKRGSQDVGSEDDEEVTVGGAQAGEGSSKAPPAKRAKKVNGGKILYLDFFFLEFKG